MKSDIQELLVMGNDLLLLACDGLTKVVSNEQMQSVLTREANLDVAADLLFETAKQNQSDDNITCMLIRLRQPPWHTLLRRTKHQFHDPW